MSLVDLDNFYGSGTIHLLRSEGGGADCGQMCFGLGAEGTFDTSRVTCGWCKMNYKNAEKKDEK